MSSEPRANEASSFWKRQFAADVSAGQVAFDVAAGILLPIACLLCDPIVFRSSTLFGPTGGFGPVLGRYLVFGYLAIGIAILSLAAWLAVRRFPALFAGLLAGGTLCAVVLGIVLLPFSLFGLLFLIGALGFSPFVAAFVFWRNTIRTFRAAQPRCPPVRLWAAASAGLLIAIGGPAGIQGYVRHELSRATQLVQSPDADEVALGIAKFRLFRPIADLDELVWIYHRETDSERRGRLADAYRQLTGTEIEARLVILTD